jgi:hypothetical protein
MEVLAASMLTLMTVGSIYAVQQAQLKASPHSGTSPRVR